jgi:tetratricopeptide (TPR) repeat protein
LEFLLGRHADLQASARFFAAIYPEDPSAAYLEAADLAMHAKLDEARERMMSLRRADAGDDWTKVNDSLPLFATVAKRFDPDVLLINQHPEMPNLDVLTTAEHASGIGGNSFSPHLANRMPFLPCIQKGLLEGRAALSSLMVPFIGNFDISVARIKTAWQHHPEALVPAFAGIYLETHQPTNGVKSLHLLALQADLFQLAADSPSVVGGLDRTSRYLAAKTEFELIQTNPTNAAALRKSCLGNINRAVSSPETSIAEDKAYYDLAMKLGDYELAREFLFRLEQRQSLDPATLQARVDLEIATGNFSEAWRLVNQILAAAPDNARALADRKKIEQMLARFNELFNSQTQSLKQPQLRLKP